MFTLKELHGKLVPINVCYTIVDEVSYMQLFLSKDKKVKKHILEEQVLPHFEVKKAYDDKKKNVKMYRKEGIDAKKVN